MKIGVNTDTMKVSVIQGKNIVKQEDITKEELPELMSELCKDDDVMLRALRFCNKDLGTKKYLFKDAI